MSIVTDRGPTENDIVIATNGSKRRTKGTKDYLALVTQHYEEYIKIESKFSKEKKEIVQKILTTSLETGRFMKEVEGVPGQWFVLSEKEAKERVKQRFCDETRARKKKQEAETKRVAAQAQKSVHKARVTKKATSNKTNKSRKIVKDAKVSKAAKVATGINTDPPASKGGVTIVRHDAVTTPTSGTDTCKSFEPIFSLKCVASNSNERLKMEDGMDDIANKDLLEFLDNYEPFGPIIDLASFSLVTSVLEEDVTPNERLATEGGLDDMTADELLILGELFEIGE